MSESVMIGITAGDHRVNAAILAFMVSLAKREDDGRRYQLGIVDGAKGYDFPRNSMVKMFLDSECDRLWFIDNDTVPPKNAKQLLDVDADITTGIVPVYKGAPNGNPGTIYFNAYSYVGETDKFRPYAPRMQASTEAVDAGGCASMVIRRHVLEDERLRYDPTWIDIRGTERRLAEDEPPAVFRVRLKPNGQIVLGEDMDFCDRAGRLGYTIKCYTGATFGHLKEVNILDMLIMHQAMYSKGAEEALIPAVAEN